MVGRAEALGNIGISMFFKLGVSNVGKLIELVATALRNFGLDLLGFYEGLNSLGIVL